MLLQGRTAVVFPGSNCDWDAEHAIKDVLNVPAARIWHKSPLPSETEAVIVPGGFSFGDYLRCGAIARFSPIMNDLKSCRNLDQFQRNLINFCHRRHEFQRIFINFNKIWLIFRRRRYRETPIRINQNSTFWGWFSKSRSLWESWEPGLSSDDH